MKKAILLASALAFGGVAFAQTTPPSMPADTGTMPPPSTPDAGATPTTPDAGAMPGGTMPGGTGGDTSMPGATTPDANGAAMPTGGMPAGGTQGGGMTQPGTATGPNGPVSLTPTQGPTDLPMCSKTVTDNCKSGGSAARHTTRKKHR